VTPFTRPSCDTARHAGDDQLATALAVNLGPTSQTPALRNGPPFRLCLLLALSLGLAGLLAQPAHGQGGGGFRTTDTRTKEQKDADAKAAAAACGTCCGGGMLVIVGIVVVTILIFVLNIVLLIWVARDAKARGMDSAVVWMILVMFTGVFGLLLYIFSRPQGELMRCPECGNNRLAASRYCPHCGNE
jgi:Phospholipase_D-nuclease N-terminal